MGDPVTLYCDGKASSDESEIIWRTPHQLVAKYSNGQIKYGPGFENRVRFENVDRKGGFSLHINPTVFSDTDMYRCFSGTDLIKTWNLVVTGELAVLMLNHGEPRQLSISTLNFSDCVCNCFSPYFPCCFFLIQNQSPK